MSRIHFLNVKEGDCSIIQHYSGRVSVIDVSNAKAALPLTEGRLTERLLMEAADKGILGNFNQKKHPVNPVTYL